MTSNPYQSPTTVSPPAPTAKIVRWPFILDLALCSAAFAFTIFSAFITNFVDWRGDWDNFLIIVSRFLPPTSLCVSALGDIFAWQGRARASRYLKLAALLVAIQLPMIIRTLSLTLVDGLSEASFIERMRTIVASESAIFLLLPGVRIIYNIIFYYWAIRQARSYLVAE